MLLGVGGWPFLDLALGVKVGLSVLVSGGGLALLSRDWGLALARLSSVVVGPSFLPFLLAFSVRHPSSRWGLALSGESWPCLLGGNWLPPSQPFLLVVVWSFLLGEGFEKAPKSP